jgi:hypothetical protein
VGAQIDVGAGEIRFNMNGKEEKFDFRPRQEQCSLIRIKYGLNPQGIREVEIQPQKMDRLIKFINKEAKKRLEQQKSKQTPNAPKSTQTPPKKTKKV